MASPAICSVGCDLFIARILLYGRNGMEPNYTKVPTAGEELSSHRVGTTLSLQNWVDWNKPFHYWRFSWFLQHSHPIPLHFSLSETEAASGERERIVWGKEGKKPTPKPHPTTVPKKSWALVSLWDSHSLISVNIKPCKTVNVPKLHSQPKSGWI